MKTEQLKHEAKGWVVINIGHPRTGNMFVVDSTFSYTRTSAIKKFIEGSGNDWRYWKRNFNFRVSKASMIVTIQL